ncbi:MAG TPA: PilZ domain-containing protein [Candidatus Aquilonibacter sp.]|jgi:hypothetical protein|nr:PilZ domain-containing protein [Candidatus Aquilonibacter sp.]
MSSENNLGSSYLAALKQSAPANSAAAAPPARTENRIDDIGPVSSSSSPSEKRRSPRYKCQGSANLREIRTGVATWATFTDISFHGCYVEASSTFSVGAQLSITLDINGFRLETKAEVRIAYPGLGMGVAFSNMLEPDRQRLRDLLTSLSRPSANLIQRIGVNTSAALQPENSSLPPDPALALREIINFFEQRQILSREEFHRILRKVRKSGT